MVTVLIPMRNEETLIATCLASLRSQNYPADRLEILVLDGESTDRSGEIVMEIAREDPRVRLLQNPGRTQAAGLNLGIREARGEIIVRADAHATYGPSYVAICVDHLTHNRAENVGGLQRAVGNTPFTSTLAVALTTLLGAGNAAYRQADQPCFTDTVWLGSWKRQTLLDLGGFNESMPPNEDYEFNFRLRKLGGRVLLDPALPGLYYPRSSPVLLWRQYFRYGRAKVRMLRLHPTSLALRQLIPPLMLLLIFLAALTAHWFPLPIFILGGGYVLALLTGSLIAGSKHGMHHLLRLPVIYFIIHFAWALGFWREILFFRQN